MPPWTFIAVADMQPGSTRSFRYDPALVENWQTAREQIIRIDPDLILIPGDLTRDGSLHRFEFEQMKEDLDALPFPYHAVPGNMDTGNKHTDQNGSWAQPGVREEDVKLNITSQQVRQYSEFFGPLFWTILHKNVRFSGFCDILCNSGLPEEEELWRWMEDQAHLLAAEHHVWIMHYAPFIDHPGEGNWDITDSNQYLDWYFSVDQPARGRLLEVFKATGASIVISGHIHCRRHCEFDGIRFDFAPATCFGQFGERWPDGDTTLGFLRYDVSDSGIARTFVPLETVSTRTDKRGPGGHPPPEIRDYSQASE